MKNICKICNKEIENYKHYRIMLWTGEIIIICDNCYQNTSILRKIDGQWEEHILYNNKEYNIITITDINTIF